MKVPRRRFLRLAAGAAALSLVSAAAQAQVYPTRTVRIIVPFPPAGLGDLVARLLGQWLTERLGQSFVIENRPGAGSNIGTEATVNAAPDGYTLLLIGSPNVINATLYEKLKFNFLHDIAPVAGAIRLSNVVEVNPSVPATTIPQFIAYAKANPGKINMASNGTGTVPHLAGELFKMMAGVNLVHVPYRGAAPALTDMIGGQVQISFDNTASSIEHIRAGRLRALAVTSATRIPLLPDLPPVGRVRARLRGDHLDRHRRATPDAGRHHRQAEPRDQCGAGRSEDAGAARRPRRHRAARHAGGIRKAHGRRCREMGQGGEARRPEGRLIGARHLRKCPNGFTLDIMDSSRQAWSAAENLEAVHHRMPSPTGRTENPMNSRRTLLAIGTTALLAPWLALPAGTALAQAPDAKAPTPGTLLITLGTRGGPLPTKDRAQSSNLLVVNGTLYLIDAGDGATRRIVQAGYDFRQVGKVFITHPHSDHTAGLATLMVSQWEYQRREPLDIYGGGVEGLVKGAIAYLIPNAEIRWAEGKQTPMMDIFHGHDVAPGVVYHDANVKVTAVENTHFHFPPESPPYGKYKSYSYRFETPGRIIVFTGDTGPSDAVTALAKGADVLVTEVGLPDDVIETFKRNGIWQAKSPSEQEGFIRHVKEEHVTPEDVGRMAAKAGVKTVVMTHLGPTVDPNDNYHRYIDEAKKYFSREIVLAKDLMRF
jgi:tripartite-type tricarboxylate transporter receptor subunit TctC/ribonuclease BN (tRNA processing enzyme)